MFAKPDGFVKWAPKQYNWLKEMPGSWRLSHPMWGWQKELFSWGPLILGNLMPIFRGQPMTIETGVGSRSLKKWRLKKIFLASRWETCLKKKGNGPVTKCFEDRRYLWGCGSHTSGYLLVFGLLVLYLEYASTRNPKVPLPHALGPLPSCFSVNDSVEEGRALAFFLLLLSL